MITTRHTAPLRGLVAALLLAGAGAAHADNFAYVGEITCLAFNFAPVNTMLANGQLQSISENTALFSLLGTNYGGNGTTTYGLPDLSGRTMIHAGQGPGLSQYVVGQMAGSETVALNVAQMPPHNHLVTPTGSSAGATLISPAGAVPASTGRTLYFATPAAAVSMALTQTQTSGGGAPVSILQPSLTMNCVIVTRGVYPPRP